MEFVFDKPHIIYSVLKATTGSFLAAAEAGTTPEMAVKAIEIKMIIPAQPIGKLDIIPKLNILPTVRFKTSSII
jgi:hypothetical protein